MGGQCHKRYGYRGGRTSQAEQILEQAQTSRSRHRKEQTWSGERMTESGETTEAAVQPTEQSTGGTGRHRMAGVRMQDKIVLETIRR